MNDDESPPTDDSTPSRELVLVGERVPDTGGFRVLRQREDRVEVGELRGLEPGRPLTGEVVKLHPTERHERLFECETLHEAATTPRIASGPPQVANKQYRRNWEQIFGALADAIDAEAEALEHEPVDVRELN